MKICLVEKGLKVGMKKISLVEKLSMGLHHVLLCKKVSSHELSKDVEAFMRMRKYVTNVLPF